jgi:hypothetical protein
LSSRDNVIGHVNVSGGAQIKRTDVFPKSSSDVADLADTSCHAGVPAFCAGGARLLAGPTRSARPVFRNKDM